MTICLAAVADDAKELVLVSDSRVSFGPYSADRAVQKNIPFFGEYALLFAGNDVAHAGTVIRRAATVAQETATLDPDHLAEIVFRECQIERDRVAEAQVLRKHLITLEDFKTKGKELCTDTLFYDLHARLEQVSLSLDFLLAGFDESGMAHIRFINCETPPQNYDPMGFWAVGSGADTAIGSYCHAEEYLGISKFKSAAEVTYHALAAKFMSESATNVGKDTFVVCVRARKNAVDGNHIRFLTYWDGIERVREEWKEKGAPKAPDHIEELISAYLIPPDKEMNLDVLKKVAPYSEMAKVFLDVLERDGKKIGSASPEKES